MRRLAFLAAAFAFAALAANAADYAHGYQVDMPDLAGMRENISEGFWGTVTHGLDVLADFIGKVLVKLANAILVVLHDLGIGGHAGK